MHVCRMVISMVEGEKLQKIIARSGVCSRRSAEELIQLGKVKVNGKAARLGQRASDTDEILVDGKIIAREAFEYYILNKPRGTVCTRKDEMGRPTVVGLVKTRARIFPVGRLDEDTTGLLILTNDGELAQQLIHPSSGHRKTYVVHAEGASEANIEKLGQVRSVDGKRIKKPEVSRLTPNSVQIIISEGLNHQVRKMCQSCGIRVIGLARVKIGGLGLESLSMGRYKKVSKSFILHGVQALEAPEE